MAVKIRLRRTGKRNAPSHRVVVTDSRNPRDGRFIEIVGIYNPRQKQERIDLERVDYWMSHGAQPSETVDAIIKRARAGISFGGASGSQAPEEKPEVETPAAVAEKTDEPAVAEEPDEPAVEVAPESKPEDASADDSAEHAQADPAAAAEQEDDQEK